MIVAIPIASAILGAIVGTLFTQYIRRAKPALIIDELSRSPDVTPHKTGAVPNLDLAAACAESEFIPSELSLARHDERVSEQEYVESIHAILDQAELAIEGLPAISDVARTLNDSLQRSDYATFQATFGREFLRLWPPLIVGYSRGKFEYETLGPPSLRNSADPSLDNTEISDDYISDDYDGVPNLRERPGVQTNVNSESGSVEFRHPAWKHIIVEDSDGDFLIPLSGPRNLVFPWRYVSAAQQARARIFSMRTAISFASNYEPDLQEFTNFLLALENDNRAPLESLQQRLNEELLKYERIVIKGFVANRGGSPVTVTNTGRLFVGLAGYAFTDNERTLKSLAGDHEIEMRIGADRDEGRPAFDSAITVEGGSVARFVATSTKRIRDLPDPAILVRAMTGGERKCYLGTMVVSQGRGLVGQSQSKSQLTPSYTDPQPFRDSAAEVRVPPRSEGHIARLIPD